MLVHKEYQSLGIGKRMMEQMLSRYSNVKQKYLYPMIVQKNSMEYLDLSQKKELKPCLFQIWYSIEVKIPIR